MPYCAESGEETDMEQLDQVLEERAVLVGLNADCFTQEQTANDETLRELEELSAVCRANGLYLFLDGARMGYGLAAKDYDVTLADIARLCDVFYIGGTKVGALFGEVVVISNPALKEDFRYIIKQHGGKNIHFLCIVAAPEGLEKLHAVHPDVKIFVGNLDRELNDKGYICPGLGDCGDRIFGTK